MTNSIESTKDWQSEHDSWPIFNIAVEDGSPGPTDFFDWIEKPAGAKGFIQVVDGHLANGDGSRWRIWGQNLTARTALPPMHTARVMTRHLAKYGINCLRLHFMDLRWPNGLILRSHAPITERRSGYLPTREMSENTRSLDPEALARLDYLVACCKENGIYVDLNLNVARPFTEGDGVAQAEWIGYAKAITYFDPRLIELQKEYAAQLLDHTNPFTGVRYADEPAVALVELVNENSLLESWLCDRLRGEQTQPCGTWADIPPVYAAELDRRWNARLVQKYGNREALLTAWEGNPAEDEDLHKNSVRRLRRSDFLGASRPRFADETQFYAGVEQAYFEDMTRYLRETIGVKQIILGSSDHNQGLNNPFHLENLAHLGITDGHFYWQHPEFPGSDWSTVNWEIKNTPMVDSLDRNVVARVARSAIHGLPYLVSETNCPFPNDYASGFVSILSAYARFQDWDGIFFYTYNESNTGDDPFEGMISSFFAMANDPVKMGETAAAGLAFLRGDVQSALHTIQRHLTRSSMLESQHTPLGDAPYMVPYLPGRLALRHRVEIADFNASQDQSKAGEVDVPGAVITSDTGEIHWEVVDSQGHVRIDTPRWQAIFGRAGKYSTANFSVSLEAPYAGIQVISLEDLPICDAGRLLLLTTARVANTGMRWRDPGRQSLGDQFGQAPLRIEPVSGTLSLQGLQRASAVIISPLDGCGQPTGQPYPLKQTGTDWQIPFGDLPASIWYWITVEHG